MKRYHYFIYLIYIIVALSMVFIQPFGNPPDEYNRFLIPEYIMNHGTLPNGYDEEIRIYGYGFSYAFQPILPYMLQGYTMRLVSMFTDSPEILLYTGRLVNFFLGLIMVHFVLKLSRKWFADERLSGLFALLILFLPQSLFVHTYINTDSCCMLSIVIMLYGLTKGIEEKFSKASCIYLSIGIILCALSYYNAYGYILSCILLFITFYLSRQNGHVRFNTKPFLKQGLFISTLVLLGIGWWFVRSYLLYDGDFLGLNSRDYCASLYALPEYHPDTRNTYQNQGLSIFHMLFESDFIDLSTISFIGAFGAMNIVTSIWIYRFYKVLFGLGILTAVFFSLYSFKLKQETNASTQAIYRNNIFLAKLSKERPAYAVFFHANMVFCIVMPVFLSIYYSYTTDFQPQGRYLLPMLVPFGYYCVSGIGKLFRFLCNFYETHIVPKKPIKSLSSEKLFTGLCIVISIVIVLSLLITVYGYAYPYYLAHPIAP